MLFLIKNTIFFCCLTFGLNTVNAQTSTIQAGVSPSQSAVHVKTSQHRPIIAGERGKNTAALPGQVRIPNRPIIVGERPTLPASPITIDVRLEGSYATHRMYIKSLINRGHYIELLDGSIWKVQRSDRRTVKHWNCLDNVVIKKKSYFFWNSYSLVNLNRSETVSIEPYFR